MNLLGKIKKLNQPNIVFGFLIFLGIGGLIWGLFQMKTTAREPFRWQEEWLKYVAGLSPEEHDRLINGNSGELTTAQAEELKKKDTDHDGLSDYDEIYVYHTNPYLPDSDGDGIPDKQEILNGTDPNCPEGKTCTAPPVQNTNINTNAPTGAGQAGQTNGTPINGAIDINALSSMDPTNLPPQYIRQLLTQAGASPEALSKLDDATLKKIFNDTLTKEMAKDKAAPPPAASPTNNPALSYDSLSKMTGAGIRQLLLSQGVAADLLNKFDDATLKSTILESVK